MSLIKEIKSQFEQLLNKLFPEIEQETIQKIIEITPATNEKFGHYQCNSAMKLTKKLAMPPRDIAQKLKDTLESDQEHLENKLFSKIEIAGPGFINLTISNEVLENNIMNFISSNTLPIDTNGLNKKVIVDFSSPNIAKEMHVGHLRSTIIGDCISRMLEFLGYDVLRLNHIGDWGTQFGMLIAYLKETIPNLTKMDKLDVSLSDLVEFYKASKEKFDKDLNFKKQAQEEVVRLQAKDPSSIKIWKSICQTSKIAYDEIYNLLDIRLIDRGESFYNPMLQDIIKDFDNKKLLKESDGAKCVFLDGFTNREGENLPLIIQKSDAGFNYATTDLAAIKHRILDEKAKWIIYVTDAGQAQHFKMVFKAAFEVGYNKNNVRLDHVPFGLVLREDGKKFKTREGDTTKLIDLLNTAIKKAKEIIKQRTPDIEESELDNMANILGINAIKYADLSGNRTSDYVFSFDKMLKFEGNTAAFLLYALVRIKSIKRKIGIDINSIISNTKLNLETPDEIALGIHLNQFSEILESSINELLPNRLCEYLYKLAEKFHVFFHNCRVEGANEQNSRLLLCEACAKVMQTGFKLLGLKELEKM